LRLKLLAALLGGGAVSCTLAQAPPRIVLHAISLEASGLASTGARNFSLRLYDAASGGTPLYQEPEVAVFGPGGSFAVTLGDAGVLPVAVFDRPLWLALDFGSGEYPERFPLRATPQAMRAASTERLVPTTGLTFLGTHTITGVAAPVDPADLANKAFVDAQVGAVSAQRTSNTTRIQTLEARYDAIEADIAGLKNSE
jgi:hypothetical protein